MDIFSENIDISISKFKWLVSSKGNRFYDNGFGWYEGYGDLTF